MFSRSSSNPKVSVILSENTSRKWAMSLPVERLNTMQTKTKESKTTNYRVPFTVSQVIDQSIFVIIALVQKYHSRELWVHEDAFDIAMDIFLETMQNLSETDKSMTEEIQNSYSLEEQCSFQINHGYSKCSCGNHSGFKELEIG